MNQMDSSADKEANTEGLDLLQQDTRIDILENKVTLCVSDENKSDIQSFDDLAAALKDGNVLMAMGKIYRW